MTSRYRLFNPIALVLLFILSSCTLISVGRVVEGGFGKHMTKGNPKGAAKYSTSGFGNVLRKFTPTQLKAIMALGAKSSGKGGKPAKASYHSFTSSGNKALMVVKQGKAKVRFHCRKIKGEWRVDDMVIVEGKVPLSFRSVLGIFASVFDIYDGLKIGKAPKNKFGVKLGGAMTNIAPLLSHFLKNAGPLFPEKKKGKKDKKSAEKKKDPFDVKIKTDKKGGTITVKLEGVKVLISLSRNKDLWKFEEIKIDVKKRPPLYVAKLINIGVPWLKFYLEIGSLKGQESKLSERFLLLMDPSLREKIRPFIMKSKEIIWPKLFAAMEAPKTTTAPAKKEKFDLNAILKLVQWEIKEKSIIVKFDKKPLSGFVEIKDNGQLSYLKIQHGELSITPTDFAAFSPWLKFVDSAKVDLSNSKGRSKLVNGFVSLLSKNKRSGIEGHIPSEISIPVDMILATLMPKNSSKKAGKNSSKGSAPLVDPAKIKIKKSSDEKSLFIQFPLMGSNASIEFAKESAVWRLHKVQWKGKEILDYLKLVPMVLRLAQGVVTTDAKLLASAFGDNLQNNLQHGLKEMFLLHGKKMKKLGTEVSLLLLNKISKNKKTVKTKDITAEKPIVLPLFIKGPKGNYSLDLGKIKVAFNKKKDGTIGFGYSACSEKTGKTKRRRRRKRKSCFRGYKKSDPLQLVELLPLAVSYFYGVADFDYRSLRTFSTYKFYKSVWRVVTRKKLRGILRSQKIDIKVPTAQEIVDLIIPPANAKVDTKKKKKLKIGLRGKGFLVSRDVRYPFIEIWLTNDGKKIDITFIWDKKKKMWVMYDIEIEVKFFGKMGIGKLVKAL
jgi:hypothetical protein